jgi:hypothetical protein
VRPRRCPAAGDRTAAAAAGEEPSRVPRHLLVQVKIGEILGFYSSTVMLMSAHCSYYVTLTCAIYFTPTNIYFLGSLM